MSDLRYALRFLWAHKAFSATAVLTLGLGLGANTALYGLLNAVLRPLPLPAADRLVAIVAEPKGDDTGGFQFSFSTEQMEDFQQRADVFSDVVGSMARIGGFTANGQAAQFWFAVVSENYFTGLGVRPAAGSLLTSRSGSPVHLVLGHSFWTKHFGGDSGVIGMSARVNGGAAVIVGVVEPSFRGTMTGVEMDGYIVVNDYGFLSPDVNKWLYRNRKARPMQLFARLKPGVTLRDAQSSVDVLLARLAMEHPESDQGFAAAVVPEPLARPIPMRGVRDAIPVVRLFIFAIAALVLLIACMNVANLLLVRATTRQREMAIRAALGASRGRLIRLMVIEGLVLSMLGGAAGYLVGQWVSNAYVSQLDLGADLPLRFDTSFDWRVFTYSLAAAALTGFIIGVWPAWRSSRADARGALHDGGKGHSDGAPRQRVRRALVIGQIAGALVLLVIASLFIRTLTSAQEIDLGFDANRLASVRLDPRHVGYDVTRTHEFYTELQRRIRSWPDAEAVSVCLAPPMSYLITGGAIYVEGRAVETETQPPAVFISYVGHDYFTVLGIPILRGRAFAEEDEPEVVPARRYAIVNEAFAAKYWPGEDAIGKRFRTQALDEPLLEVIGIARDSKYVAVFESRRPYVYLPESRDSPIRTVIVRASGNPALLLPRLEREIRELAPGMPIADLRTMRQALAGVFGFLIFRVGAIQAGGMGLIGLLLAVVGVYGVVSFGVSLRTREIGIRVALGAHPRAVLRLIVGQGGTLVGIGIAIGILVSIGMARVLAHFLPLVNASDWVTFGVVACGLSALALTACYLPARRATKLPVVAALRHE